MPQPLRELKMLSLSCCGTDPPEELESLCQAHKPFEHYVHHVHQHRVNPSVTKGRCHVSVVWPGYAV